MAMFIEAKLKPDHEKYPPERKFVIENGFELTIEELRQMLGPNGKSILEASMQQHQFMKNKGVMGIVNIVIKVDDLVDVVRVILPSADAAKKMLQVNGNWSPDWVCDLLPASAT